MALKIFNKERNKFTIPGNSEDIKADSINSVQTKVSFFVGNLVFAL